MAAIASFRDVTLTDGMSTVIVFSWNTSDSAKGNYTITAYVEPVFAENDTEDNTCIGDWVYIVIPGNVDANKIVDMLDLYYVALHYGANRGEPNYISNQDIDDNGIINMLDLYIAATHYGQHDP
jgi:hypothetical protein